MKYRVSVSPPKTKSMAENAKLMITLMQPMASDRFIEYKIEKFGSVEFDVPNGYDWFYTSSNIDERNTFLVIAEFVNSKGTKKDRINLVPEKVEHGTIVKQN